RRSSWCAPPRRAVNGRSPASRGRCRRQLPDPPMTDFADVEEFAREHSACGGITPSAAVDPAGGFQLRLTCACGAALPRFVTTEEAKRPLPLPRSARRPAAPPAPPAERTLGPSPDLEAAMQELLTAEPRPAAAPPATPPPASAPAAAVPSAQPSAP